MRKNLNNSRRERFTAETRRGSTSSKRPAAGNYVLATTCPCGKRGYDTKQDARVVVKEMRRKNPDESRPYRAYQCAEETPLWHVGRS